MKKNNLITNTKSNIVCLEPTSMLRIDLCRNRGGELQQLWIDKLTGEGQWKPVPMVYNGSYEYNK